MGIYRPVSRRAEQVIRLPLPRGGFQRNSARRPPSRGSSFSRSHRWEGLLDLRFTGIRCGCLSISFRLGFFGPLLGLQFLAGLVRLVPQRPGLLAIALFPGDGGIDLLSSYSFVGSRHSICSRLRLYPSMVSTPAPTGRTAHPITRLHFCQARHEERLKAEG